MVIYLYYLHVIVLFWPFWMDLTTLCTCTEYLWDLQRRHGHLSPGCVSMTCQLFSSANLTPAGLPACAVSVSGFALMTCFKYLRWAVEFSLTSFWCPSSPCPPSNCYQDQSGGFTSFPPFLTDRDDQIIFLAMDRGGYSQESWRCIELHSIYNLLVRGLVIGSRIKDDQHYVVESS